MKTLTKKQVAQFERDGFLNGGRVLSDSEVNELSAELDRIIAKGPDGFKAGEPKPVLFRDLAKPTGDAYSTAGSKPVWQIVNIWEASPLFEAFVQHTVILRMIHQLTGFPDLQVWHDQVQYKPADTGGATGWHQDAPLWPSIEPMTPVSAWIPFDDAMIENGCMWMVPGSHKWGNQQPHLANQTHLKTLPDFKEIKPADPAQKIEVRPCPVKRGEVHFHHSLTWHGSPENRSPRPRRALAIHYMTSEARFTGKDHPMRPFIQVQAGEAMRNAGPHFPAVCVNGEPTRRN